MSANEKGFRRWLPAVSMLLLRRNERGGGLLDGRIDGARRARRWGSAKAPPFPAGRARWCNRCRRISLGADWAAGFIVLSVAYATDVYSAHHAGLIAGTGAGSWSAVAAVTMPLFGHLFDLHRYSAAFWIAAAIGVAGYLGWLALSRAANVRERFSLDTHTNSV